MNCQKINYNASLSTNGNPRRNLVYCHSCFLYFHGLNASNFSVISFPIRIVIHRAPFKIFSYNVFKETSPRFTGYLDSFGMIN